MAYFFSFMPDFIDTLPDKDPSFFEDGFLVLFVINMSAGLIWMIMMGFYIVYIIKSNRVKKDSRVIWILVIIFGSFVGQIVFWFMHIWPEKVNYEEVALGPIFPKNSSTSIYSLHCPGCGYPIHESYKFCKSCGKSLDGIIRHSCSKCGKSVSEEWAVCAYCGALLKE